MRKETGNPLSVRRMLRFAIIAMRFRASPRAVSIFAECMSGILFSFCILCNLLNFSEFTFDIIAVFLSNVTLAIPALTLAFSGKGRY